MDSMDRLIDPGARRLHRLRRLAVPVAGGAAVLAALLLVTGWLRPAVRRDRVRTAVVERGEVAATLDASGLVVPEFEQMLTAPVATRVAAILEKAGAAVRPGQPIVRLDDRDARREVTRLSEQIALKENARQQIDLELARTREELAARQAIKALELKSARFEVERNRQLFDLGLIPQDEIRKAETDVERITIEQQHLQAQLANAEQDLAARQEGLALEIDILEEDRDLARERLAGTTVASDRGGFVTWVVGSEGLTVAAGEVVARVADRGAYRVDASLSDVLARRLTVGLPATVRSGETRLSGRVDKILPTVVNGVVTFEVALDRKDDPILRPNLRVDVHAVTERRSGTLRLRRCPVVNVDGREAVFVIRGDEARRIPVTIGLSSFEYYEITAGLAEGDEVIISDMSDFRNAKEVQLR
jgi:HlyD family secretion protein